MAGCFDEGFGTDDHASDGGAETFAEAQGDAIETGTVGAESGNEVSVVFSQGDLCRNGFPEAGAVAMKLYVVLVGEGGDGAAVGEREDLAGEGVLESYYPCWTTVDVVVEDGVFFDVGEG